MEPDESELHVRLSKVWEFARDLQIEINDLKSWRASQEAVASWRKWALPLGLSVGTGVIITLINALLLPHGHG